MVMNVYHINTNELPQYADILKAGDRVKLSGTVYTARDAAHKRIMSLMENGEALPFDLNGAVIYYAGPTPTRDDGQIGSFGPTTSSRMDKFAPMLLDNGLAAMIGKGDRSKEVYEAIKRNKAIYFCAVGGAGALAAKSIKSTEEIAFFDLGCESVKKLDFNEFPLIVGIDANGGSVFNTQD
jgi:fumarate hydratase subunit beta